MYKLYVLLGNSFYPLEWNVMECYGMLQAKHMTNVLFSLPSIAQCAHRFRIYW